MVKNYKILASEILTLVGGEENVENVVHCVTRLRFYLRDASSANTEKIEKLDGVMGVVQASGQYQVVIGPAVDDVYKEITGMLTLSEEDTHAASEEREAPQSSFF